LFDISDQRDCEAKLMQYLKAFPTWCSDDQLLFISTDMIGLIGDGVEAWRGTRSNLNLKVLPPEVHEIPKRPDLEPGCLGYY
jgi:hypothetical protein